MKIRSFSEATFLPRVNSKQEKDSFSSYRDQQKRKSDDDGDSDSDSKDEEFDREKLLEAIQEFGSDTDAVANGLTASQLGDGPGLRVVLKDSAGTVIRQLTGEEFLKLREAVAGDGGTRGKILDQKL